jgi:hypothetical protein
MNWIRVKGKDSGFFKMKIKNDGPAEQKKALRQQKNGGRR